MKSTVDPRVLDEAADWLMRLHDSRATPADRLACERWQRADPAHAQAWARAELLMNKLGGLPSALAMPALGRPAQAGRRAALGKLAALLASVPAGWLAWQVADAQGWTAAHRTATGERRELMLADGTRVTLNTASALDVRFDAGQRLLVLRAGEISVATAPDNAAVHRPFRVVTREGLLQALGTRFTVRQDEGRTRLAVLEGAVRITPERGGARPVVVEAGGQTAFSRDTIDATRARDPDASAWTRGMLVADRMRLADFAAEVARYRPGLLACGAAVAELRVSGAFPIDDTDRVLRMLVSTYPVEAVSRLRGHWVTLVAP
ncbi:FecR domain-containing protein [Variovorax sp. LT1R16]|uniref:FecR domain-containing protein n=1 Tax=Variovorax sp. LT1R16 TaxID=3443728 RepID=UPI003F453545